MRTSAFFKLVKSRLNAKRGCFFANIVMPSDRSRNLDRIAGVMSTVWKDVRLLDAPRTIDRNAVVMAGAVAGLELPSLLMKPKAGSRALKRELKAYRFRTARQ